MNNPKNSLSTKKNLLCCSLFFFLCNVNTCNVCPVLLKLLLLQNKQI